MNLINRTDIATGVSFNYIKDDRFKNSKICANFILPLSKETASANSLLVEVLSRSCAKYPNFKSLNTHLNMLYGATVFTDAMKHGDKLVLTISVNGLDDKYSIDNEIVSSKLSQLLCELIFNPNFIDGQFNKVDFEQEKRQLIDTIDADYNDKRVYAIQRMIEEMCSEEVFGNRSYGTKEEVNKLVNSDIVNAWKTMLKISKVEILMVGSSKPDEAIEIFKNAFNNIDREVNNVVTNVITEVEEVKNIEEKMDIAQSKLVMGFRSGVSNLDKTEVPAFRLMVAILGGTPQSKFFVNVREKHSLCYYCAARPDVEKGLIIVDSGVENENIEKAKKEILNQIDLLKNGELTDFEINSTKLSMVNSYTTATDSIHGIEAWYSGRLLNGELKTTQEVAQEINAVTKEEIIKVANKIKLDTIYVLTSQ